MPSEGLRVDLELLVLVVTAGLAGYMVTDQLISNALLSGLIAALFFIIGLQIDMNPVKKAGLKTRQVSIGLFSIFIVAPAVAVFMSGFIPDYGEALLVIGVSAAGISSARIWSNMTNSDGDLADKLGIISLFVGLAAVPVLIFITGLDIDYGLMASNVLVPGLGLLAGIMVNSLRSKVVTDLKLHFSKASFWLIVAITTVQTHIVFESQGYEIFYSFFYGGLLFAGFTFLCFGLGYLTAKLFGVYEKEARAIGFVTGSKNIAVAFFIALHIDGTVVALVGLYYFIRQISGVLAVDLMVHGELRTFKRLVLKASAPLGKLKLNK